VVTARRDRLFRQLFAPFVPTEEQLLGPCPVCVDLNPYLVRCEKRADHDGLCTIEGGKFALLMVEMSPAARFEMMATLSRPEPDRETQLAMALELKVLGVP
jgi:hypothetical protein